VPSSLRDTETIRAALTEADQAASVAHDFIFGLNDVTQEEASAAIWRIHNALRPLPDRLVGRLQAAEQRANAAEHLMECANTPLMRDVLAERDAAEARVAALETALRELEALVGIANPGLEGFWVPVEAVKSRARAALSVSPAPGEPA
jgi:hypothetical protein